MLTIALCATAIPLSRYSMSMRTVLEKMQIIQIIILKINKIIFPMYLCLQGSSDVSGETIQDLHRSAKALHIEYSQLKMETQKKFEELQYIMKQVCTDKRLLKVLGFSLNFL